MQKEFIATATEIRSQQELQEIDALKPEMNAGYLAVFTNEVQCGNVTKETMETLLTDSRLLELRVFTREAEWFLYRDHPDDVFHGRYQKDDENDIIFSETHFLDRDTSRGIEQTDEGYKYFTMGGGAYQLPMEADSIVVHTYFAVNPSNGIQYAMDWRMVSLQRKEGQKG